MIPTRSGMATVHRGLQRLLWHLRAEACSVRSKNNEIVDKSWNSRRPKTELFIRYFWNMSKQIKRTPDYLHSCPGILWKSTNRVWESMGMMVSHTYSSFMRFRSFPNQMTKPRGRLSPEHPRPILHASSDNISRTDSPSLRYIGTVTNIHFFCLRSPCQSN